MKALMVLAGAVSGCAALIILVLLIRQCCRCNFLKGICNRIQNMLMFNSILRYFMMTFLSISVGCCRQLRRAWEETSDIESY